MKRTPDRDHDGKGRGAAYARNDLARLLDEVPALREIMDATVARHVPKAAIADPS